MRIVALIVFAIALSACASLTRGSNEQVQILSNPPEAQVRTSNGHVCVTPCNLQLDRKAEFSVIFSKPGYHSAEIFVRTRIAGEGAAGLAGNILVGGLVGAVVDASTGAALDHYPNPVSATLIPLKKGEQPQVFQINPAPPEAKVVDVEPRS